MASIGILSRDAKEYQALIEQSDLINADLVVVSNTPDCKTDWSQIDILLADPNLATQIVEKCTHLKWLQSTWAGNTPLLKLQKKNYQLCGVKDVFGASMREYVFAYLLHFSRNIEAFQQAQHNALWQPPEYAYLKGKTLGIMGLGSIGKTLAKAAKIFEMQVHGLSYSSHDCQDVDRYFSNNELIEFAGKLDYLVCLLPDTDKTYNLVEQTFLNALPNHCVLINAGRGQVINQQALLQALHTRQLRAAVLDVFEQEPLPADHPFWHTQNVYITQHTAAKSEPQDIVEIFMDNFKRYHNKQTLKYLLEFERGY
ncbi:MAG: phosphoglycerate dehydrogenase-like enzyme [Paraglaciecola sp.]|jgi:phosphoglycerate dehydrogenase-like enzyme